jgi:hypothetical protein
MHSQKGNHPKRIAFLDEEQVSAHILVLRQITGLLVNNESL